MALPRWLARVNRRYLNPGALKRGAWPVLIHRGRTSGTVYRTPLSAYPIEDGYLFTINYGSRSDWPKNVLTAGRAAVVIDGQTLELESPRLASTIEGYRLLGPVAKTPPSWVGVEECLIMHTA